MSRISHILNLTGPLALSLVSHVICFAQEESFRKEENSRPSVERNLSALNVGEIASALYGDPDCRHLAFTCGNHESLASFKSLDSFLKTTACKDGGFRYVLVELPADFRPELLAVSTGSVSYEQFIEELDEPWRSMLTKRPQLAFYATLVETIRKINVDRPDHPILLVPVDGFTTKRVMYEVGRMRDTQANPRQTHSFIDSVNRERDTASNVLEIVREFPNARGAILFHQGHLLRGLRRELPELDDETHRLVKLEVTHSTWVGFAQEASPDFGEGLRIILFDEVDNVFNPHGVLRTDELGGQEYTHLSGSILRNTAASRLDPVKYFQPDSRVRRVHQERQHYPESIGHIFDAFVVVPE